MVKADCQQLQTIRFYSTMCLKLKPETLVVNQRVGTKSKNIAKLYGKSGISADILISLYSKAEFFE